MFPKKQAPKYNSGFEPDETLIDEDEAAEAFIKIDLDNRAKSSQTADLDEVTLQALANKPKIKVSARPLKAAEAAPNNQSSSEETSVESSAASKSGVIIKPSSEFDYSTKQSSGEPVSDLSNEEDEANVEIGADFDLEDRVTDRIQSEAMNSRVLSKKTSLIPRWLIYLLLIVLLAALVLIILTNLSTIL